MAEEAFYKLKIAGRGWRERALRAAGCGDLYDRLALASSRLALAEERIELERALASSRLALAEERIQFEREKAEFARASTKHLQEEFGALAAGRDAPAAARDRAKRDAQQQDHFVWPEINSTLRLLLTPDDVIYDVGANVGVYTQFFVERCAQVVAFEPNPDLLARLKEEIKAPNVMLCGEALSDRSGTATFHIDIRPAMPSVSSSLLVLSDLHAAELTRPIEVDITTVDDVVRRTQIVPTFIKIDVEGNEPAVLAGARDTIAAHRPKILFEFWENHWDRFKATFEELAQSYFLVRVSDGIDALKFYSNNTSAGGADILCLPLRGTARPGARIGSIGRCRQEC